MFGCASLKTANKTAQVDPIASVGAERGGKARGRWEFLESDGRLVFVNRNPYSRFKEEERAVDHSCFSHSPPDQSLEEYNRYRRHQFRKELPGLTRMLEKAVEGREAWLARLHRHMDCARFPSAFNDARDGVSDGPFAPGPVHSADIRERMEWSFGAFSKST